MRVISTERWTYDDMKAKLPAESRYELRNFNLIDMPSPKRIHQRITGLVYRKLFHLANLNQLGEVFVSPFDVILEKGNVCQPDVFFLSKGKRGFSTEEGVFGTPDLTVEVVSKGSVVRDYVEKKNDYEQFGVSEYWIIDPLSETIIVYALVNAKYVVFSAVEEAGTASSKLLEGFQLTFEEVFQSEE